jgi:peptide/nickel transport system substrate-binding protein
MRRPSLKSVVLVGAVLVLSACGGGSGSAKVSNTAPTDHALKLAFLQDPGQPPDPDVFYAGQGLVLQENVYEGLLQYQPGTDQPTLVGDLATAWTASPDNTTFTFTLRSGVTFHDGTPFDSSAIKASFDRRTAVGGGPAYMVSDVTAIDTPSPTQAVIHLKAPNPAFLSYLASPYGPRMMSPKVLSEHAGTDSAQKWLATHDAGTGPYTLTKAEVGEDYQLKAYAGYWGDKPYFTSVDFPVLNDSSALQVQFNSGDLDGILSGLNASASKAYQDNTKVKNWALPDLRTSQIYLNPTKPLMTTAASRTAVLQAVDTNKILKQVYPGRATKAVGNYPANMLPDGQSPQDLTYDTSKLKALVAALPADQKKVTVGFDTGTDDDQTTANLIAADLTSLGLTATVQGLTTSTVFGYVGGDASKAPDMLVEGAWPDSAEAYAWAHIIYDKDGGLNYLGCNDPALTSAIAAASTTSSVADPAPWAAIGVQALKTGCWMNTAYLKDTMVTPTWMTGVQEAHVVTAPTSLLLAKLGVKGSS